MNWSTQYFEYFNAPFLTWMPDYINHDKADIQSRIINRVHLQLNGYSEKEIQKLITAVDTLISDCTPARDEVLEKLIKEAEDMEKGIEVSDPQEDEIISRYGLSTYEYLSLIDIYDLSSLSSFIEITWGDVFAILSLNTLGEALAEIKHNAGRGEYNSRTKFYILNSVTMYLFDAVDLVSISERLTEKEEIITILNKDSVKQKISLKNKMAVNIRHEPARRVKDRFIEHYLSTEEKTTRKAIAIAFYRQLSPADQIKLTPSRDEENARRTLTDALREFEKLKNKKASAP